MPAMTLDIAHETSGTSELCAECDRLEGERERRTQILAGATALRNAADVLSDSVGYINFSAAAYDANLDLEIAEIEMRFHLRRHDR
jgi:hypothetical protein